jgi:hypothetical protein
MVHGSGICNCHNASVNMYNVNVLDFNSMKKDNMFRLNTDLRIMQNISPH